MAQAESQSTQSEVVKVTRRDLPLCCPRPGDSAAGLHPRVYLPIEKSGTATCPYCGTRYELTK